MKLDDTISKVFQEMSLSELETPYHFCELELTQILSLQYYSKNIMHDTSYRVNALISLILKETFAGIILTLKNFTILCV